MVNFKQATTTLTGITILWDAPPSDNGAIVEYVIRLAYDEIDITVNTTKEMYVLANPTPANRVEFTVSAVSICGAVGEPSTTSENTDSIRKSLCMPYCKYYHLIKVTIQLVVILVTVTFVAIISRFRTEIIYITSVVSLWTPVDSPYLYHYIVYY